MDLQTDILRGNRRSDRDRVARWVGRDTKRFAALMDLYLHGDLRTAQLAAGAVFVCADKHPALLTPWWGKILRRIKQRDVHDAVRRAAFYALQCAVLPKQYAGMVANMCFAALQDVSEPIAIRVFAMTVLARIAEDEPGLQHELRLIIDEQLPFAPPAFLARARMVVKKLDRSTPASR